MNFIEQLANILERLETLRYSPTANVNDVCSEMRNRLSLLMSSAIVHPHITNFSLPIQDHSTKRSSLDHPHVLRQLEEYESAFESWNAQQEKPVQY